MIKHIIKIVWNRRRANLLIALEISVSFLVLFAVSTLVVVSLDNYRHPLGFAFEGVWNVTIERKTGTNDRWSPDAAESTRRLLAAVRDLPEVESAAAVSSPPYSNARGISRLEINGRPFEFDRNEATDEYRDVMKLALVSGRWFSREDTGRSYQPVIINKRLAQRLFGSEEAVGKVIAEGREGRTEERIIGVITDFRKEGEYAAQTNYAFYRVDLDDPKVSPPTNLALRLRPGTSRAFEERLAATLQGVARNFSFVVAPVTEMRDLRLKIFRIPIIATSLVAGFLMIMVGLGLTGVLWQNVTQRTREIGLRRAKGATVRDIHAQILGELFVITSLGLLAGSVVVFQFPLLALIGGVSASVYAWSLVISILLIYGLTMLCGLYPSHMASRIQPAEALHYE